MLEYVQIGSISLRNPPGPDEETVFVPYVGTMTPERLDLFESTLSEDFLL